MEVFLAAAATVTKIVDFTRNSVDPNGKAPKWVWNLEAFLIGLLAAFFGPMNIMPTHNLGQLVTGLAIGAAASGFHEVFDFFGSKAKRP